MMSLRARLTVVFSLSLLVVWGVASFIAWVEIHKEINEILDAQQNVFARRLAMSNIDALLDGRYVYRLPALTEEEFQRSINNKDVLAFAIFNSQGRLLMNDGLYGLLPSNPSEAVSMDSEARLINESRWRMVWIRTPENERKEQYIVAVGQHLDYREELALDAIKDQLIPWAVLFPLLLGTIFWLVNREFRPLQKVADSLASRRPGDDTPIESTRLPKEIRPFVDELNALFVRIAAMLARERRFTSYASHEMRSPLAGLRVQAEVAQLANDDPDVRERALSNLTQGIDRMAHLVEQLLALSRLDSTGDLEMRDIDWSVLLQKICKDFEDPAHQKGVNLQLQYQGVPSATQGHELFLSLLMRNLVDNALRYSPPDGNIRIVLMEDEVRVLDDGKGVSQEHMARLGERFFRPSNQNEPGTGLGLSIVKRVADMHGFRLELFNRPEGGFCASLNFKKNS